MGQYMSSALAVNPAVAECNTCGLMGVYRSGLRADAWASTHHRKTGHPCQWVTLGEAREA